MSKKLLLAEKKKRNRKVTHKIMSRVRENYGAQSERAAADLGVEREIIEAIIAAECDGRDPYRNGRILVRFENHLFHKAGYKHRNRVPVTQIPGAQGHYWKHINAASQVSKWAAYCCTSFGPYQIMGWHYTHLGYKSPIEMAERFQSGGLDEMTTAFINHIRYYRDGVIHTAIKKNPPDWGTAGLRYNGVRAYGIYMKAAYDIAKTITGGDVSSLSNSNMSSLVPKTATPSLEITSNLSVSDKKVKNISHLSKRNTPTISIKTDKQGKSIISYEGKDPLNNNIGFSNRDLNKEVNRLFGYSSWNEYIQDNKQDLTATTKKDQDGNVTSAASSLTKPPPT